MRKFLAIVTLILIQGCIAYPGTYYYPQSKNGKVITTGHCGDNTPSKLVLLDDDVKVTTQAADVLINYDQTWIWFEAISDKKFKISAIPNNISFNAGDKVITPHEIKYFYRVSDEKWFSYDYNSLSELPSDVVETTNLRITFMFKKQESIEFRIRDLKINNATGQNVNVNFKATEAIRVSALNC